MSSPYIPDFKLLPGKWLMDHRNLSFGVPKTVLHIIVLNLRIKGRGTEKKKKRFC